MRIFGFLTIYFILGSMPCHALDLEETSRPCENHAHGESLTLEEMMSAIKRGNDDLWDSLVPAVVPPLTHYFNRQGVRVYHEADDLVQLTLVKMYRKRDTFDENRKVLPWIYGIARNQLVDWFRRQNRVRQIRASTVDPELLTRFGDDGRNDPRAFQLQTEQLDILYGAIPELRGTRRQRVLELFLQGLSDEEIGIQLNIAPATVKWNRFSAIHALRDRLNP